MTGGDESMFERIRRFFSPGGDATKGKGLAAAEAAGEGAAEAVSCEDALRLVHDFLDGELEGVSGEQVRLHFEVCQRCYPHLNLESVYRQAIQRACGGAAAPEELKNRIADLLAEARAGN